MKFRAVTAIPFNMPVPIMCSLQTLQGYKSYIVTSPTAFPLQQCNSSNFFNFALAIHFSHHDINAPENHHHIGDGMSETEIFQHSQVDETWRTHTVAIRICAAVTD